MSFWIAGFFICQLIIYSAISIKLSVCLNHDLDISLKCRLQKINWWFQMQDIFWPIMPILVHAIIHKYLVLKKLKQFYFLFKVYLKWQVIGYCKKKLEILKLIIHPFKMSYFWIIFHQIYTCIHSAILVSALRKIAVCINDKEII